MFVNVIHGFCMALADSVPGVSGGTIAFILGFYDKFIENLHNFFENKVERKTAFLYLSNLGLGWIIGFIISITLISRLLEANIHMLSSLFLGLTITSIPFVIKSEKDNLLSHKRYYYFSFIGFMVVIALVFLRHTNTMIGTMDLREINLISGIYIFFSGAVAISAMVLPGISGSSILLIAGLYMPMVEAVNEVMKLKFEKLSALFILILGILCGIFISVKILRNAMRKNREKMIYLIIGMIVGSLVAIIMGPTTLNSYTEPLNFTNFNIFGFLIGVIILFILEVLKISTH